ncbi:hypothetical protein OS493_022930 [Desmophyllum pertusum]|uniref:Uncharacterized protein n=1 Tax=Desmophyllum pertusum TaxID=174260 RepID=A0A9W9ZP04_9CNID|nr:hypothetical protein OS493_022930 [Desmophyllum pertusum]
MVDMHRSTVLAFAVELLNFRIYKQISREEYLSLQTLQLIFSRSTGSGIGTLTFGPVLQYILQRYGLAISLRILSGVSLLLLVAALTYKPFRSPLEELFEVSHVEGLGISPSKAALLIGFMSIASTISRIGFGKFSDHPRVNRLFMTQFAILGFGVTTTLCPLAKSYASLVIVVVALGLFDGLYVVLIAVLNTDIVGVHKLSAALGSLYGVISFTLALGPPCAGLIFDVFNSYHTAFYICGATTTLSSCLMFLIPWLMPNQQGGVFRRDSCQSRLESLLSSQPSTPGSRQFSRRFFADGSGKSSSSRDDSTSSPATGEISLCEADRIELEYLKGFANNDEENDDQDGANKSLCVSTNLSVNTSKNTVYNSTMSHRGSITKFLLQQQSRNSSPVSGSRRGSTQSPIMGIQSGSSSRSSMSSFFGGSRRTSLF